MERVYKIIQDLIASYIIGLLLTFWFYFPVMAINEVWDRRLSTLTFEEAFWYFVAFSMSAVMGLYFVDQGHRLGR